MDYYWAIKRTKYCTFVVTWIAIEIVMLNEVRHRKTSIILHHLYVESKKEGYKWTYLQNRVTDVENKIMFTRGRGVGINWVIRIDIITSPIAQQWRVRLQCRRLGFDLWVGRSMEKEMATHSSILAWAIPSHEQRSLAGCSPWGRKSRTRLSD